MRKFKESLGFFAVPALVGLMVVACESPERPSNLSTSEADAQQVESDRIQATNTAHAVIQNLETSIAPVEAVLRDLSNVSANVNAKVAGQPLENLHLADGFTVLDQAFEGLLHGQMARSVKDGTWSISETVNLDSSIKIGDCSSFTVELRGQNVSNSKQMQLNLIQCGSSDRILLADINADDNSIDANLHLENLKNLSVYASNNASCVVQVATSDGEIASQIDCKPIDLQLSSGSVEISPLSVNVNQSGVSGRITVHGYDQNHNEVVTVGYPKN